MKLFMKRITLFISLILGLGAMIGLAARLWAATETNTFQTEEYGTIRWGGRENTHFIRANGEVEMLSPILTKIARPDRVDERAFYLNIAMNAVAKEGYEFAWASNDLIVMKRRMSR